MTREGLVVRRNGDPGLADFEYDFAIDGLSPQLQDIFASAFEAKLRPTGGWRTRATLVGKVNTIRSFAKFCKLNDVCVDHVGNLSVSILNDFRLYSCEPVSSDLHRMLRVVPGLPSRTQAFINRRIPKTFGNVRSYDAQQMSLLRSTIGKLVKEIELRISNGISAVDRSDGSKTAGTVVSALLTGDQDEIDTSYASYQKMCRMLGEPPLSLPVIQRSIFISTVECTILVVALALETGWNLTSILELKTPVPSADPHNAKRGQYHVELEKRRRGVKDRFETQAVPYFNTGKRSDILTRIISITAPLRSADKGQNNWLFMFRAQNGTSDHIRHMTEFSAQHLEKSYPILIGLVSLRRIRRTVNVVIKNNPNQNSVDTHMSTYVLRDELARDDAAETILAGIEEARSAALARFAGVVALQDSDSNPKTSEGALAGCKDPNLSPLQADRGICRQSFLACFGCSNAVLKISYLPRNAALWKCLVELRTVIQDTEWAKTWQPVLDRLEDVAYNHLSKQQWDRALDDVSEHDLGFIRMLLAGDLDA